jgi:hypothetical protein
MQFRVHTLVWVAKPQPKRLNSELPASNCISTRRSLMKKLFAVVSLLIVSSFVVPINSNAGSPPGQQTRSIDRREARQALRIRRGIRSGSLTRRETARLARQQARIRAHERHAKADGVVTRRERLSIQRQENRANRNIYRKRHNRR